MQYSPTVSIITVEANSLSLICPLALGPWSGVLLELSCSLAACFHRPPAFLRNLRFLPGSKQRHSFRDRHHHRARDFVVPGLLLTAPAGTANSPVPGLRYSGPAAADAPAAETATAAGTATALRPFPSRRRPPNAANTAAPIPNGIMAHQTMKPRIGTV